MITKNEAEIDRLRRKLSREKREYDKNTKALLNTIKEQATRIKDLEHNISVANSYYPGRID